jgi:hypothetical protein
MSGEHPTRGTTPVAESSAAPWQVNWQAYDVPRLAEATRDDGADRSPAIGARAVGDLTAHAGELLQAALQRLEQSWSDRSPAASEVFAYTQKLAASLADDADAYYQLAADVGRITDELAHTRQDIEPLAREWDTLGEQPSATAPTLSAAAQDLNRRGRHRMTAMEQAVRHMRIHGPKPYVPKVTGQRPHSGSGPEHDRRPDFDPVDVAAGGFGPQAPRVPFAPPAAIPGIPTVLAQTFSAVQATTSAAMAYDRAQTDGGGHDDSAYGGDGPSLSGGPPMTPFGPGSPVSMMPLGMNSSLAPGGGALILPGPGVGGGGVLRKATMSWSATSGRAAGSVIDGSRAGQLADWARDLPQAADSMGDRLWQVAQGGPALITPGVVQGPGARQAAQEQALRRWYDELAQPWRES